MKVSFYLYSRLPLGRRLTSIIELCRSSPVVTPEEVLLTSRERRADLPTDEVIRSAEASDSDSCEIRTVRGDISMAWVYGERRHVPRLWGTWQVAGHELADIVTVLGELATVTGTTYGVCDLEAVRQVSMRSEPDTYETQGNVGALRQLFWWNYFGTEYRRELAVTDDLRRAAANLVELEGGGLVVVTRPKPNDPVDQARLTIVAKLWPVFRKHDQKARFRTPVRIDYSQVWGLPSPRTRVTSVREIVGPPDEFIASVAAHAERFREWMRGKRLGEPQSEEALIAILQKHEQFIRDELLVPAIAAYGELVRQKTGGAWKKATLVNRGEPVVVKPGRPWSARRVILEVLKGLEPFEV